MQGLVEIRWHARAGQGAVTASQLIAETALEEGKFMQSMPEYGPERTGAPLRAYTRVSDEPIEIHNNVTHPDIVIILDDTLIELTDVLEGIKPNGKILVNTRLCKEDMEEKLGCSEGIEVAVVPATDIALDTIGRDIPNAPIAGALSKFTELISLDNLLDHVERSFSEKFSQQVVQGNLESIQMAYEDVSY
ncbi:MAG: 2-oxoacid:acceptor oxidoreductase family protein [Coriobacteriia bacterium]|nr:2-oxoacid:acceptor oxidoreductase family protein [Coriobacteriia bacterium]